MYSMILSLLLMGSSPCEEHLFCTHSNSKHVVEGRTDEMLAYSFCRTRYDNTMRLGVFCRWDTPGLIMALHGYKKIMIV
jgi:hypothetical protein